MRYLKVTLVLECLLECLLKCGGEIVTLNILHGLFSRYLFQRASTFNIWKHLYWLFFSHNHRRTLILIRPYVAFVFLRGVFSWLLSVWLRFIVDCAIGMLKIIDLMFADVGIRGFGVFTFLKKWVLFSRRSGFFGTYINLNVIKISDQNFMF